MQPAFPLVASAGSNLVEAVCMPRPDDALGAVLAQARGAVAVDAAGLRCVCRGSMRSGVPLHAQRGRCAHDRDMQDLRRVLKSAKTISCLADLKCMGGPGGLSILALESTGQHADVAGCMRSKGV